MAWTDYEIVGSYNNQRFTEIDAERTINMFEYIDPLGKKPRTLIPTSGIIDEQVQFPSVGSGGFRAQFSYKYSTNNPIMICVIGNSVYKLTTSVSGSTAVLLGTINGTSGYVGIDANQYQIIIVDGTNGWIYDVQSSTFLQITDPGFPVRPIDVTYLDGFFVVADGGTNNFYLSSFNNGLIWSNGVTQFTVVGPPTLNITLTNAGAWAYYQIGTPVVFSNTGGGLPAPLVAGTIYYVVAVSSGGNTIQVSATKGGSAISLTTAGTGTHSVTQQGQLQFGSITSHPGNIVACRTLHRRLFLFSENYTEVWENAGLGTNLPFRRNNSLLIELGTPAIGSIRVGFDMMFFLSQDKDGQSSVQMVLGAQAVPVSTRALDYDFAQHAAEHEISDATGILIKENGIIFYRLNFTEANHTYVYNVTFSNVQNGDNNWHEEEILNGDRHPAQTHAYFDGNNYYGNYETHILYRVDSNTVTNAGENIPRIRIGKSITSPEYKRLRVDRFHLDLVQGQSTTETFYESFTTDIVSDPDILILSNTSNLYTGQSVKLSTSGGTLPDPLAPFVTYYVIMFSSTKIKLASSYSNAIAGTAITLNTDADGLNYVQVVENNNITPEVFLSYSKDGGVTYGNRLQGTMGKTGERTYRTVWRKLGTVPRGQGFVPKIEFFNQLPFVILGAAWVFEQMPE